MDGIEDGRRDKIMSYGRRVIAAIALLACLGLWSSYRSLREALWGLHRENLGHDEVTLLGTRLEGVRHDLPSYGEVGYVAEPANELSRVDYSAGLTRTRFWLAPLIVLPYSHQQHFVVGNFHKPPPTKLISEWHLVPVKDYGNGIILFVNEDR